MRIYVDADACPVVRQTEAVARRHGVGVVLICDTNHVMTTADSEVIVVGAGADAVDFALVNRCRAGDIVVTQDYGVAAMALGRGARAIHQSGMWYTDANIDGLLAERHIKKEARRVSSKKHMKGPKKRTSEDDRRFEASLERMILEGER